jgi:hypothetical protein
MIKFHPLTFILLLLLATLLTGSPRAVESLRVEDSSTGPFAPRERPSLDGSPVDAVIVTTAEMSDQFQVLADWHVRRGVRTVVRTVEWVAANYPPGVDRAENVRIFLQDAHLLWGLQTVILGGDTDELPVRYALSRIHSYEGELIPSDLYYSCLDGNWNGDGDEFWSEAPYGAMPGDEADLEPELLLGRIPVSTPVQAAAVVSKLIGYRETTRDDFQSQIAFLAEVLFPSDWVPGELFFRDGAQFANEIMSLYLSSIMTAACLFENHLDSNYNWLTPVPLSVQASIDTMNTGNYAFVDHDGHGFRYNMSVGDGSVMIDDARNLTNDMPFHITLMNCTSTAFDFDCLGENYLRNPDGGAMAVFGTTRSSYPSYAWPYAKFYYYQIFQDKVTRPGHAIANLRQDRLPFAQVEGLARWTYFIINFLGDPILDLWAGAPVQYTIDGPVTASVGEQLLPFHVTSGGEDVSGAQVTLYKADEVWSTAATDAGGLCQLPARPLTEGELTLTVWGVNAFQTSSQITVEAAAAPFVHLAGWAVDDSPAHDPINNDDGAFDSGELVHLQLDLRNAGVGTASSVQVAVSSLSDSLTVINGSENYPDIPAGNLQTGTGAIVLSGALGVVDGSLHHLVVTISESSGSRGDTLIMTLQAPDLLLAEWEIFDSVADGGDGDGVWEENEPLRARPRLVNLGSGSSGEIQLDLVSLNVDLTVDDGNETVASLSLLEHGQPAPGFLIRMVDAGLEYLAQLTVTDGWGRTCVDTVDLLRPSPPGGLDSDSSLDTQVIKLSWQPATDADLRGYHVYVSQGEVQAFERYTLLPVEHCLQVISNLTENSLTDLYVTSVDSSGMESLPSEILHTSTNPSQIEGFPQETGGTSATSLAVGNIAGDDGLEVVTAADYVYAWHHDGQEVRDGDGESESHGVFSTSATDMVGAVTLLPLQGRQYRQILVASRASKQIFAFDQDGEQLPGWPQTTANWVWDNIMGADLDGDLDLEVVAIDHSGNVYAFHHDGSEVVPGSGGILRSGIGGWSLSSPAAADLDGDGADEVVIMGSNGSLYAVNGDGTDLPGFPLYLGPGGAGNYMSRAPTLIANLDGDPTPELEIIVQMDNDSLFVFSADGTRFPGYPLANGSLNVDVGPGPVALDHDLDGDLELLLIDSRGGGDCSMRLIQHTGEALPGWPVDLSAHTQGSPVIGDLDGDGVMEFVLGSEQGIIYGLNSDGTVQPGFPINVGGEVRGTPSLADLDGDGDIELLVSTWNQRVLAWDFSGSFSESSCPWPTLSGNYFRNGRHGDWDDVPVLLWGIELRAAERGVRISWTSVVNPEQSWGLERQIQEPVGSWSEAIRLGGELSSAQETVTWLDDGARAGSRYRYHALLLGGGGGTERFYLGEIELPDTPFADSLRGAWPNPFNPATTISFELSVEAEVRLEIYSISGRRVRSLISEKLPAGPRQVVWYGRDDQGRGLASGVYLVRIAWPGFSDSRRLVLLK